MRSGAWYDGSGVCNVNGLQSVRGDVQTHGGWVPSANHGLAFADPHPIRPRGTLLCKLKQTSHRLGERQW